MSGLGAGGYMIGGGAGGPVAVATSVNGQSSGILYTISRMLGSTSTLSLITGTNANLTLFGSAISAGSAIGIGSSQVAEVREVNGQLAVEYPVTLNGLGILAPTSATVQISTSTVINVTGFNPGETIASTTVGTVNGPGNTSITVNVPSNTSAVIMTTAGRTLTITISAVSVGATSTLYLPYDGLRIVEGAGVGAKVATLPFTIGSSRNITSVKNSAGATVSGVFTISGSDLVASVNSAAASDGWYDLIVQEVGTNTTTTTLTIYVVPKGVAQATWSDDFGGAAGTLATRPGWTIPAGATTANLAVNGSGQLATGAGNGAYAMRDTGTLNHSVHIVSSGLVAGPTVKLFGRFTSGADCVELGFIAGDSAPNGAIFYLTKVINSGRVTLGSASYYTFSHGNTAMDIEMRFVNDTVQVFVDGVARTAAYDVSDVLPSSYAGVGSHTSAGMWESFSAGQTPGTFSSNVQLTPVYAVDPVDNKAQVPVSMAFNTAAPTALQYRIEDSSGSAVGADWSTLGSAVIGASGFAATVLAPVGGNYRVAVRDANATAVVGKTSLFGIGDVVLATGQSNMQKLWDSGAGSVDSQPGKAWCGNLYSSPFVVKRPALLHIAGFTNALIGITGRPCWVINFASPGQPASYFLPSGSFWTGTVLPFIRANQLRFTAHIHNQGETDVQLNTQAAWVGNTTLTFNAFYAATGQNPQAAPIGVSHIGGEQGQNTSAGAAIDTRYLAHRKYEAQLVSGFAKAYLSHHRWDMDNVSNDYIHIAAAEFLAKHAPRFAYGVANALGFSVPSHGGPLVTGATKINNTTVRVSGTLNGATGLSDTSGAKSGNIWAGWQFMAAAGYDGSQNPDSYFSSAAAAFTATNVSYSSSGTTWSADFTIPSTAGPIAVRNVAGVSGATPVFDGALPFGGTYNSGAGLPAFAQIVGAYSDGSTSGVMPMINALVAT